jgi:hypothetical protein
MGTICFCAMMCKAARKAGLKFKACCDELSKRKLLYKSSPYGAWMFQTTLKSKYEIAISTSLNRMLWRNSSGLDQ